MVSYVLTENFTHVKPSSGRFLFLNHSSVIVGRIFRRLRQFAPGFKPLDVKPCPLV